MSDTKHTRGDLLDWNIAEQKRRWDAFPALLAALENARGALFGFTADVKAGDEVCAHRLIRGTDALREVRAAIAAARA